MSAFQTIIVDDDLDRVESLRIILEYHDHRVVVIADEPSWRAYAETGAKTDVVLLGPCSPDNGMLSLYEQIRAHDGHTPIIAMVESGDDDGTSELDSGVVAKLSLPIRHHDLNNALQQVTAYREHRHMGGEARSIELFRTLVGSSSGVRQVRKLIEQVADSDANVLLLGESGTGKEVVARNVHYRSTRRYKPFVPVNCGAIPSELLESELFGHEKGAFTGAISARRGRFEMAEGGTLFLDEIGDMPLAMQVKLLRVLQERTFERVGSNKSLVANVRIIAATHNNLEDAIAAGRFREDLYYRLNVFPIEVPPLRERIEDLGLLINDLISRMEHEGRGSVRLTPTALRVLCQYQWPGNVRELANLIERLVILYPYGVVDAHDIPEKYRVEGTLREVRPEGDLDLSSVVVDAKTLPREGLDLKEYLSQMECRLIQQALDDAGGVVAHAAKRLRMGRTTLVEKMRKFGINRRDEMTNI
ncbi:MAG: sigma-54 dependent transcriptional regulator [Gammaproteobacteria bacterium]|nr:sigma-54 dependent transcriptional regulator [Gammaproteobacteria bacterium]